MNHSDPGSRGDPAPPPNFEEAFSLPSGGGAIRGMGETFHVDPATGTARFTVPLPVSPARALTPALSLAYDSGQGMTAFGLGWDVAMPRIERRTSRQLADYDDDTAFRLAGGDDLVPALDPGGTPHETEVEEDGAHYRVRRFRMRTEGDFARIEHWHHTASGTSHWRSWSADNVVSIFGESPEAREADPEDAARIFSWHLQRRLDAFGNLAVYEYKRETLDGIAPGRPSERHRAGQRPTTLYPKRLLYGNRTPFDGALPDTADFCFALVFDYGDHDPDDPAIEPDRIWPPRPDPRSRYDAGFERRLWRRCARVIMFHAFEDLRAGAAEPVRALELDHGSAENGMSLVRRMRSVGFLRGESGTLGREEMPWLEFEYQAPEWSSEVKDVEDTDGRAPGMAMASAGRHWEDLHSEGLPGLLSRRGGEIRFQRNLGDGRLGRDEALQGQCLSDAAAIEDIGRVGRKSMVTRGFGIAGHARLGQDDKATRFRSFPTRPTGGITGAETRLVELDGDGLIDLLHTDGDYIYWWPSRGEDGFGSPRRLSLTDGRRTTLALGDALRRVFLADMSGDGLTDIVRVENGRVSYWPNLGRGRFGHMVEMEDAPVLDHPDQFDPGRIRLADIDGSGLADLCYLSADGLRLWRNRSGNGWTAATSLPRLFPPVTQLSGIQFQDVTGSGTAALVWTDDTGAGGRLRYVPLTGGIKPHLLCRVRNGRGAETCLSYASSTRFYLEDRAAGRPWATRIGYPVHCLVRQERTDHVTGLSVTSTYAYHHGAYDPHDREFRGFARVDQTDTEIVRPDGAAAARPFFQPPVHTRRWFHTGLVPEDGTPLEVTLAREYYALPGLTLPDGQITIPDALETGDWRMAQRALRGALLRQEVYALDDSAHMEFPYSVTVPCWEIVRHQPSQGDQTSGTGHPAVFQRRATGKLVVSLDRRPEDPRISQSLVLERNAFGQPVRQATIGHARRTASGNAVGAPRRDLPEAVADAQARTHVTIHHEVRTDAALAEAQTVPRRLWLSGLSRHLPRPFETNVHEVTGLNLSGPVSAMELDGLITDLPDYDDPAAPPAPPARRVIGRSRVFYMADDLAAPLSPGRTGGIGLVHRTETLAMTAAMVSRLYEGRVTGQMLHDAGYVHGTDAAGQTDADHWTVSSTAIHGADAAQRFYLPEGRRDPFGAETRVTFDAAGLLPVRLLDAAALETRVINDYRVLAPRLIRDANGNWTAVRHDALGRVIATAEMGKLVDPAAGAPTGEEVCEGDTLTEPGIRITYDHHRWAREGRPVRVMTERFVTHRDPNRPGAERESLVTHEYSDGFGNLAMSKLQATPGPARRIGPEDDVQIVDVAERWIGNGRTVLNNKGQPLRRFEPYFSASPDYEDDPRLVETGVSGITFYDAIGRAVGDLATDGTWGKQVITPWRIETWDAADTCLIAEPENDETLGAHFAGLPADLVKPGWHARRTVRPEGDPQHVAAKKSAAHAATPTVGHADALGRVICTETFAETGLSLLTATRLDIEGNTLSVTDARGNTVTSLAYSLLPSPGRGSAKQPLREESMDRGLLLALPDVLGRSYLSWDARGHRIRASHDAAGRPSTRHVTIPGAGETCIARNEYAGASPDAAEANLIGRLRKSWDMSGLSETVRCDFKGNITASRKRFLAADLAASVDWPDDTAAREALLESDAYTATTAYDALNRVTLSEAPRRPGMARSAIRPRYDTGGGLTEVSAAAAGRPFDTLVDAITYDAKGQRQGVRYGNHTTTRYSYDAESLRLSGLETRRVADDTLLQGLAYTYDAVGNITHLSDAAQQSVYFDNAVVAPEQAFTYDALYRLVRAEGREHAEQAGIPDWRTGWDGRAHPQNGRLMRRYSQTYTHDPVGNITAIRHAAGTAGWTRHLEHAEQSNQLNGTRIGTGETETFTYNDSGSITGMAHLDALLWDHSEQLAEVDHGPAGRTTYTYDAEGKRVRKRRRLADGRIRERLYFGALEIYREIAADGTVTRERETLHINDDLGRVALIETLTVENGARLDHPAPLTRYQLGNHLGSACLELDERGAIISYEEFHPFGTTAYLAVDASREVPSKRYRYTGKERDEETGLSYHGARYYAPWLARWTAADPTGIGDGVNLYAYVHGNPVAANDPDGRAVNWVAGGVGLVVGGVAGGGIEAARQWYQGEDTNWKKIGASAVGGGVAGGMGGLTLGGSLLLQGTVGAGAGSMVGGTTTRALLGEETTKEDLAADAFVGVVTFGLMEGGGAVVNRVLKGGVQNADQLTKELTDVAQDAFDEGQKASDAILASPKSAEELIEEAETVVATARKEVSEGAGDGGNAAGSADAAPTHHPLESNLDTMKEAVTDVAEDGGSRLAETRPGARGTIKAKWPIRRADGRTQNYWVRISDPVRATTPAAEQLAINQANGYALAYARKASLEMYGFKVLWEVDMFGGARRMDLVLPPQRFVPRWTGIEVKHGASWYGGRQAMWDAIAVDQFGWDILLSRGKVIGADDWN